MALSVKIVIFLLFHLLFLINITASRNPILPKGAIIPVMKDRMTHQYVATVSLGPNLDPVKLVVDLSGPHTWLDCGVDSAFSFHDPIESFSLKCSMAKSSSHCFSNHGGGDTERSSKICTSLAENTVSGTLTSGELHETEMGLEFHDGVSSGSFAGKEQFLLLCASNLLLERLATGARGMLGLDSSRISLPSQFTTKFGFLQRKFSLCLSSSNGFISLGGNVNPNSLESEISSSVAYTPLISKRKGYYISTKSINVSGKKVSLRQKGSLETKLSTVAPYTILGGKIYGSFVEAYVKAATSMNLTMVAPVAPFEACFSSKGVENDRLYGPNVPVIELVLQSEMVKWKVHGRNSMVGVSDEVMCLGFLNGGLNARDSIVLGGFQIEDRVLEFNLQNNMLGFSSLLEMAENMCSVSVSVSRFL